MLEIVESYNPKVSIVIPAYNAANYLAEAIDSALAQTYGNTEIIVVNDGSNDNGATRKIALSYGDKIRYFEKENGGVSTALNTGICNMTGEYFSWLSHDDLYTINKIEKSVEALRNLDNKKTVIYCQSIHIDKNSNIIKAIKRDISANSLFTWNQALVKYFKEGSMNGCAFLIHKDILHECGLFDETLRFNQDGFMWSKIFLAKYPLFCITDICVKNRIHDKQLTQRAQNLFRKDSEKMSEYLIPKLIEASNEDSRIIVEYMRNNAKYANNRVVKEAMNVARYYNCINFIDQCSIMIFSLYGMMRPMIRKLYYKLIRKVKTT